MAAKKIQVEIVRSTAKAHLVKDSTGREGWIQARWLSAENMVSHTTFEKALDNKAESQNKAAADRAFAAAENEFKSTMHPVRVVRETEKAVAAKCVINFAGFEEAKLVWFPKSAIDGSDGVALIPGWLIRAKQADLLQSFASHEQAYLVCGVNHPSTELQAA